MTNNFKVSIFWYGLADYLMAMLAWAIFFLFRKKVERVPISWEVLDDPNFWYGILIVPIGWILFYSLFDKYTDLYRMSRLSTFARTFFLSFIGVVLLFFALILDDFVQGYQTYYTSFFTLFAVHFLATISARGCLLTYAKKQVKQGKVSYQTLLIGGTQKAKELYEELTAKKKGLGNEFVGFIGTDDDGDMVLETVLPRLGDLTTLDEVIKEYKIEETIIAIETSEHKKINTILNSLFNQDGNMVIKIIPDMYDIILGSVKMTHVFGAALIEIRRGLMPTWQIVLKRMLDILASGIMLCLLLPIYAMIAFKVRRSSKGPIFYKQERIGLYGKPFYIIKFRSMYIDAESMGPRLSQDDDPRVTPWGKIMRKYRLDELPQFWNVLIGEMSLVGPRPERQFYIDKIMERAPHYKQLLRVRPGITSWGQVKYGYASNVDEMVQRLRFDILYIENMSLGLDFKIMFYTLWVLIQGSGK